MPLPVDEWRPRMQTRVVTSVITGRCTDQTIEAFGNSIDESLASNLDRRCYLDVLV
jgi:hypothetical protein